MPTAHNDNMKTHIDGDSTIIDFLCLSKYDLQLYMTQVKLVSICSGQ